MSSNRERSRTPPPGSEESSTVSPEDTTPQQQENNNPVTVHSQSAPLRSTNAFIFTGGSRWDKRRHNRIYNSDPLSRKKRRSSFASSPSALSSAGVTPSSSSTLSTTAIGVRHWSTGSSRFDDYPLPLVNEHGASPCLVELSTSPIALSRHRTDVDPATPSEQHEEASVSTLEALSTVGPLRGQQQDDHNIQPPGAGQASVRSSTPNSAGGGRAAHGSGSSRLTDETLHVLTRRASDPIRAAVLDPILDSMTGSSVSSRGYLAPGVPNPPSPVPPTAHQLNQMGFLAPGARDPRFHARFPNGLLAQAVAQPAVVQVGLCLCQGEILIPVPQFFLGVSI